MINKTAISVQTSTQVLVGVAILGSAALMAMAGFVVAATGSGPILLIKAAQLPTSHSAVQGAQKEPMLGVILEAKNKGITVESLSFNVMADSDGSFSTVENDLWGGDLINSCVLTEKQSGNVFAGPAPVANGNILTFDDDFSLAANTPTIFVVKCDLANGVADNSYIAGVELTNYQGSVLARETANGTAVPDNRIYIGGQTDPGVNATLATVVTVRDHGRLSVKLNPTIPGDIALAGSNDLKVASFSLSATNEPFVVKKLSIKNLGDDAAIKVVKISYLNASGTVVTPVSNHIAQFSGLNMLVQPGAANAMIVDVYVDTADILGPAATGDSGMTFSEIFNFVPDGDFEAIGSVSGYTLTEANMGLGIQASTFTLRQTRPTISKSPSSPWGSAVVGRNEVLRFDIAAASNDDVEINQLTFKMVSDDNASSDWNMCGKTTAADFDIYDIRNYGFPLDNADANWTLADFADTTCASSGDVTFITVRLPTPLIITKGATRTFALYFDATGASPSQDDSVRFDIPGEPIILNASRDSLSWSDGFETGIDGADIDELPLVGGTLVF